MEIAANQGNSRKLTQVKVSVDHEIAAAFKAACAASNVSMAAEISRLMADYASGSVKCKVAPNYSTRRYRRTAIKAIIKELEQMRVCEERVLDRTPNNLQGSGSYEATEEAIAMLDAGIDALTEF